MFNYYFNIAIIYLLIGVVVAIAVVFVFKKNVLGKFWGALLVAVVGSFLGGFIEYVFEDIIAFLANLNGVVNVFPPLLTAVILLLILARISDKRQ